MTLTDEQVEKAAEEGFMKKFRDDFGEERDWDELDEWERVSLRNFTRAALEAVMPGEPVAWQPMETAPKDGTEILAAVRVCRNGTPSHWERHVIRHCEEDDGIDIDYEQGWRWEDYDFWTHLPTVPEPWGTSAHPAPEPDELERLRKLHGLMHEVIPALEATGVNISLVRDLRAALAEGGGE